MRPSDLHSVAIGSEQRRTLRETELHLCREAVAGPLGSIERERLLERERELVAEITAEVAAGRECTSRERELLARLERLTSRAS